MKQSVGVIGLGIMGSAMARNLITAGFPVSVYNRTASKAKDLIALGAQSVSSPKALAQINSIIMIIVTDPPAVWDIMRKPHGLLAADGKGKAIIQLSTLNVETTLALAKEATACGYQFLDCPVTGSKKQVEAAELTLEAGGDKSLLDAVCPVLLAIGKHIVHAGPVGSGTALKLCMNLLVAQMTTGLCEAVALAKTLKVDPAHIFDVIDHSPALKCGYFTIKKEPLLSQQYPPAFSLANMLKDVRFMNEEAAKDNHRLPVTGAVQKLMEEASAKGLSSEDLTAMVKVLPL